MTTNRITFSQLGPARDIIRSFLKEDEQIHFNQVNAENSFNGKQFKPKSQKVYFEPIYEQLGLGNNDTEEVNAKREALGDDPRQVLNILKRTKNRNDHFFDGDSSHLLNRIRDILHTDQINYRPGPFPFNRRIPLDQFTVAQFKKLYDVMHEEQNAEIAFRLHYFLISETRHHPELARLAIHNPYIRDKLIRRLPNGELDTSEVEQTKTWSMAWSQYTDVWKYLWGSLLPTHFFRQAWNHLVSGPEQADIDNDGLSLGHNIISCLLGGFIIAIGCSTFFFMVAFLSFFPLMLVFIFSDSLPENVNAILRNITSAIAFPVFTFCVCVGRIAELAAFTVLAPVLIPVFLLCAFIFEDPTTYDAARMAESNLQEDEIKESQQSIYAKLNINPVPMEPALEVDIESETELDEEEQTEPEASATDTEDEKYSPVSRVKYF